MSANVCIHVEKIGKQPGVSTVVITSPTRPALGGGVRPNSINVIKFTGYFFEGFP